MKVRKNCICVANFAQSKPSASPGSQNFAFPKIKQRHENKEVCRSCLAKKLRKLSREH